MSKTKIVSIGGVEGSSGIAVSVSDEQFPHLRVDLRFEDGDEALALDSVCVHRVTADSGPNPAISTQQLRGGFPWSTWERAARVAAAQYLANHEDVAIDPEPAASPELDDPFGALLLQVVDEYRTNILAGVHNPAALIAEKHGVKPATARSWLHRARRLGLLGPAADRAAGEIWNPLVSSRGNTETRSYEECPRCKGQGCLLCKDSGLIFAAAREEARGSASEDEAPTDRMEGMTSD